MEVPKLQPTVPTIFTGSPSNFRGSCDKLSIALCIQAHSEKTRVYPRRCGGGIKRGATMSNVKTQNHSLFMRNPKVLHLDINSRVSSSVTG